MSATMPGLRFVVQISVIVRAVACSYSFRQSMFREGTAEEKKTTLLSLSGCPDMIIHS